MNGLRHMKNIYDEIGRPSVRHHKKINQLIEPLKLSLGVDRVWRNSHRCDGSYSVIGNHPPTAEIFFDQQLYVGHPYFRSPIFFQSGFSLPELQNCHEYDITQGKLKNEGNCYHVLICIQKSDDGLVEYGFATSQLRPGFEAVYLNHLHIMNKFIDFFEIHAEKLIHEANACSVDMSKLIGCKYHEGPQLIAPTVVPESELLFLNAAARRGEQAKAILSLTKSERLCLRLYLSGNTTQSIAKKLFRSPRTIETHLENAKGKLGVNSRSALFGLLLPFRELL